MIWLGIWIGGVALTVAMWLHGRMEEPDADIGGLLNLAGIAVGWPVLAVFVFGKWAWSTVRK